MKIVIIANGYPSKREPQWGCFERDQGLALQKFGHQVSILYIDARFRLYWRKIGLIHYNDSGLSIYGMFLMPKRWLGKISMRASIWLSEWMMNHVYRSYERAEGKPDILYAHYIWNIALASKLKEKYGIPLVGVEHWSGLTGDTLPSIQRYRGDIGYPKVDKLLAVSKSLQAHIRRHFGIDSTVVYDMLGQEFISSDIKRREKTQTFRFIAVGSLIHRKGFDLLLQAFSRSKLKEKGCSIVIIGNGPEKANLLVSAKQLGISENVCLTGSKTKDEIICEMQNCHVFVLSSRSETFGVVCIEALSQGLPNIATACGGPVEFINEKNGILLPTEDVEALSNAMVNMYDNYFNYDSLAIAEECKRRFAPNVIAGQLTEIFETVVNK